MKILLIKEQTFEKLSKIIKNKIIYDFICIFIQNKKVYVRKHLISDDIYMKGKILQKIHRIIF